MNIPVATKPVLWGVAGGAIALAIAGFTWGGWTTGGKAESTARMRADEAAVAALAPVCVDRFQHAGDAPANLVAFRKVESWSQGQFVESGGWATLPGTAASPERVSAVARACAVLLAAS